MFPDLLEEVGYHVGYTGKGWGPGDWKRGGFARNPAGPEYSRHKLEPPKETGINPLDYAANFEDFLSDRKVGQPFYFWYGGFEPHRRYVEGEGVRAGKRLEEADVPAYWPEVEELISFIDFAPTFLEAAVIPAHSQMEGDSLMNILLSDQSSCLDETRTRVYMGRERHDMRTLPWTSPISAA